MNNNPLPIYPGTATPKKRAANPQTIGAQLKPIKDQEFFGVSGRATVIRYGCEHAHSHSWKDLFRCLYCGAWFCQDCAKEHFGLRKDPESILHLTKEEQ